MGPLGGRGKLGAKRADIADARMVLEGLKPSLVGLGLPELVGGLLELPPRVKWPRLGHRQRPGARPAAALELLEGAGLGQAVEFLERQAGSPWTRRREMPPSG